MLIVNKFTPTPMVLEAIWTSLLDKKVIVFCLYASVIAIVILSFSLPSHFHQSSWSGVFEVLTKIPDVGLMSSNSGFPLATSIAYSFSLLASMLIAVATCFVGLNLRSLRRLVEQRSKIGRAIYFLGILLLLIAPYVFELNVGDHQLSSRFFSLVGRNRFFLMLWGQGVFLGCYVFWLWILFELTNFIRFIFGRVYD